MKYTENTTRSTDTVVDRTSPNVRNWQDVLSDPVRNILLARLTETDGHVEFDALIDAFEAYRSIPALVGSDVPGVDGKSDEFRRWLYREHVLPMHQFGIVEYDELRDRIRLADDVTVSARLPER